MAVLKREDSIEIYGLLVKARISRFGTIDDKETGEHDEIIKFASTNRAVLAKLKTRQIIALRALARKAESIEKMKEFLQKKLRLAHNAWHFEVEDTFVEGKKSYGKLAEVLIKRLDVCAAAFAGNQKDVTTNITLLLEQAYRESFDSLMPEEFTLTEEKREELRLLLARDFLSRLAYAALLEKPEES